MFVCCAASFFHFLQCCRLVCVIVFLSGCICVMWRRSVPGNTLLTDRFPGQPCCMLTVCCCINPAGMQEDRKFAIFLLFCVCVTTAEVIDGPFLSSVCRCAEEEDCFPSHSK